ncbi:27884_t:CDS:2, partial [Gigaspora margarita]
NLSKDTNESSNPSAYEQNIHFPIPIPTIDNAALKKNSFLASPENLIIGSHYRGYSASEIEIEYSIFQSLQTTSTLNSENYKTPNGNHVIKPDYSSAIENIDSYELQASKMNDTTAFSMKEINTLNDIENIKSQLKEIRDSIEDSLSEENVDIE